jgi:uracil-DNA glycosylase
MRTRTRTKTKATPQEVVELRNLLPVLARLIENGKISIRLGPVAAVKDWLNNYQAFEKNPGCHSRREQRSAGGDGIAVGLRAR